MPGILAVVWALLGGQGKLKSLLSTLVKWRVPIQHYAAAIALPFVVLLAAADLVPTFLPSNHPFPSASELFFSFLITLPFGPLWEELAWRAFALRRLELRYSRLTSAIILGIYWGLWHIPLWLVLDDSATFPVVSAAVVNIVAWSVIWTYLYHFSSESLPVVILLHATYNTFWNGLFVSIHTPQYIYTSSALAALVSVFFARALVRQRG